jgi:hypothetical protein
MQAALASLADKLQSLPAHASARARADVRVLFDKRRDLLRRAEKMEQYVDEQYEWGIGLKDAPPQKKQKTE